MDNVFQNTSQTVTYQKVSEYLTTSHLFRDSVTSVSDSPNFEIQYGSTCVHVDVMGWEVNPWNHEDIALVRSYSYLTTGTHVDGNLLQFLMRESGHIRFGAFQLESDDRIMFAHSILGGDNMDMMELQTCILSVAAIADTYDDIIVQKFGGQRLVG
ncbi:MAG: hypothetical protein AAGA75_05245 [Cyanobacteria bacterium P01_E01_bin.6]